MCPVQMPNVITCYEHGWARALLYDDAEKSALSSSTTKANPQSQRENEKKD